MENLRFELLENGKLTGFVYHNGELLHEEGRIGEQVSYYLGNDVLDAEVETDMEVNNSGRKI